FIPDPAGRTIGEMMGCFHEVKKPTHAILEKIATGMYRKDALPYLDGSATPKSNEVDSNDPVAMGNLQNTTEHTEVLEYHGKVPAELLASVDIETPL
ncbi:MAG: hypothetical protein GTO63_25255, partial [Anaerolineae bacterium]|nr:hypothetical protein [Anaerolineae bacterium]NIN98023.1 hypothetical protein [Anaerolineae bacterium]NIQ80968.1 hypothetical protein [Anaerolineae bacterium]